MKVIYSGQNKEIEGRSIFLAGCSPRKGQTLLWRFEALAFLRESGFEGTVIVPEPETGESWLDYMDVVEWEDRYLKLADVIVFWLPRSIKDGIYGFTSNVEFGKYLNSGKIIYGRPETSDNNRYLDHWYKELYQYDPFTNLQDLIKSTVNHTFLFKGLDVQIVHHFAETDEDKTGESVTDLIVDGNMIYCGEDWYHDKISSKIEGYLDCLKNMGIPHTVTTTKLSDCQELND